MKINRTHCVLLEVIERILDTNPAVPSCTYSGMHNSPSILSVLNSWSKRTTLNWGKIAFKF